jgi:hypothetical protein
MIDADIDNYYRVMTSKGFDNQSIFKGNDRLYYTENIIMSMDPDTTQQLIKFHPSKNVVIGYHNTFAFYPFRNHRFPITSIDHFLLAETMSEIDEVTKAKSLSDLNCGSGFIGNFAAKNFKGLKNGNITFIDPYFESIKTSFYCYLLINDLTKNNICLEKIDKKHLVAQNGNQTIDLITGAISDNMQNLESEILTSVPTYYPEIYETVPEPYGELAQVSSKINAPLYFTFSSLSFNLVEKAIHKHNLNLAILNKKRVPYTIQLTPFQRIKHPQKKSAPEAIESLIDLGLIVEKRASHYDPFQDIYVPFHDVIVARMNHNQDR